jgi:hypothetical protein
LVICHFDHWHYEPLGVLTAAAEGNLTGNPPPARHPDRLAGGEKGTGNSWYALGEKIVRALGREPCGIRGNTLVHYQIPGSGRIDSCDRLPDLHALHWV